MKHKKKAKMKANNMEQERFKQMKINFTLGKNGGYWGSGLGGSSHPFVENLVI